MEEQTTTGPRFLAPIALAVAVLVASTAAAWFRLSSVQRGTLWAEDGRNFVSDFMTHGFRSSVFEPLDGYLQFLPRVITAIAADSVGPRLLVPTITLLCCLSVGMVSALMYVYGRTMLANPLTPLLLAAVPPLIPTAPRESLGTMNNLHSFTLLLAPFLLAFIPRRFWTSIASAFVVVIVVLTEPQTILFSPLVLRGISNRRKWPLVGGLLVGAAAQLVTAVTAPRAAPTYSAGVHVRAADILLGFITVPLSTTWTAQLSTGQKVASTFGVLPFLIVALLCIAAAVVALVISRGATRWLIPATILGSGTVWAGALLITPANTFLFTQGLAAHIGGFAPTRYATVTSALLLLALVLVADAALRRGRGWRILGVVAVLAVAVPLAANYGTAGPSGRSAGPTVASQVQAARSGCQRKGVVDVKLQQTPDRAPWVTTIRCSYLERAG
jgi:hypothetical protein